MSDTRNGRCRELAENIAGLLRQGISLRDADLHFLESTLGISTSEELETVLRSEESEDRENLLDLIVFPGREAKLQLEEVIRKHEYGAGDAEEVAQRVTRLLPSIRVHLEPSGKGVACGLPVETVAQYVRRLRICKSLDPELARRIDELLPREEGLSARVALRAARIAWNGAKLDFLNRFLSEFASRQSDFREYLQAAIGFLEESGPGSDLFQQLADKRLYLKRTLEKAEFQEEQLKKQNVETLIMQRVNILCINQAEVQRAMDILDDIGLAVFGRSPADLQHTSSFYFPL